MRFWKITVCFISLFVILLCGCKEKTGLSTVSDMISNQSLGQVCYSDDMVYYLRGKMVCIKSNETTEQTTMTDVSMIQQYQNNIYCIERNKNIFYQIDGRNFIYLCDLPDGNCNKFVVNSNKAFFLINADLYCFDMLTHTINKIENDMSVINIALNENQLYCVMGMTNYGESFDFSDMEVKTELYIYDTDKLKKCFITDLGNSGVLMTPSANGVICHDIGAERTLYICNDVNSVLFEKKSISCMFSNGEILYYGDNMTNTFHQYSMENKTDKIVCNDISYNVKGMTLDYLYLGDDNYIRY